MTADDLPRYQLGADFLSVYEEVNIENINKLETLPDGPEKDKLRKRIIESTSYVMDFGKYTAQEASVQRIPSFDKSKK